MFLVIKNATGLRQSGMIQPTLLLQTMDINQLAKYAGDSSVTIWDANRTNVKVTTVLDRDAESR